MRAVLCEYYSNITLKILSAPFRTPSQSAKNCSLLMQFSKISLAQNEVKSLSAGESKLHLACFTKC